MVTIVLLLFSIFLGVGQGCLHEFLESLAFEHLSLRDLGLVQVWIYLDHARNLADAPHLYYVFVCGLHKQLRVGDCLILQFDYLLESVELQHHLSGLLFERPYIFDSRPLVHNLLLLCQASDANSLIMPLMASHMAKYSTLVYPNAATALIIESARRAGPRTTKEPQGKARRQESEEGKCDEKKPYLDLNV